MKRNIRKLLSVVLALIMILSMVPMMVMAEEVHEHDGACACNANVAPAAVTHNWALKYSYKSYLQNSASNHLVRDINVYSCSCGVEHTEVVDSYYRAHSWTTAEDSYTVYCVYCGYVK